MGSTRIQRWLPLTGVLFAALMVIGFAVSGSSPDTDASNAKIANYLASTSQFHRNIASLIILWAASLLLLTFWATLRSRLSAAEGGTAGLASLAFGAGVAAAVFNLIGVTMFAAPVMAAHDAQHSNAVIDPGIYRLSQDIGYPVWIMTALIGALAVWATAAVAWRTRALPRWYAWVSIVVGVACLFSIVFFPVLVFGLWIILTSILLVARPAASVATVAAPAEATTTTPAMA